MAEALSTKLGIRIPIIQAPMAGGPDTPELVAEVSSAGGLGSLGCAYLSPQQIHDKVAEIRRRTQAPFALNLFVRDADPPDDPEAAKRASAIVAPFRAELGLPPEPPPATETPRFDRQLEAVLAARPRVFSFTFGVPDKHAIRALKEQSIVIVGTATTVDEGEALENAGVDAVVAQGAEAGGHRGTFLHRFEDAQVGLLTLVQQLVRVVKVPVIASGGLMDGTAIRAAMLVGAAAAQLGTAFLGCPEAGTADAHRAALESEAARHTVVTRAFSGRPGRGIRNRMTDALHDVRPPPFPHWQARTKDLRAAATQHRRADLMQLWAGQGAPLLRSMPAAELLRTLAREADLG